MRYLPALKDKAIVDALKFVADCATRMDDYLEHPERGAGSAGNHIRRIEIITRQAHKDAEYNVK